MSRAGATFGAGNCSSTISQQGFYDRPAELIGVAGRSSTKLGHRSRRKSAAARAIENATAGRRRARTALRNRRSSRAAVPLERAGYRRRGRGSSPRAPGDRPVVTVLVRAYARRAVRHRFKRQRDEWAETIGDWRDRTASLPRYTSAGRPIAVCPATYSDATCKTCGACAYARDAVIGFPAHGAWQKVEKATAARDVAPGESWVFRDHRTMAEVIADEATAA
jgi:hypothetical protein